MGNEPGASSSGGGKTFISIWHAVDGHAGLPEVAERVIPLDDDGMVVGSTHVAVLPWQFVAFDRHRPGSQTVGEPDQSRRVTATVPLLVLAIQVVEKSVPKR